MMMYILFESLFLVMVVYVLFILFYFKKLNSMEEVSSYECGFDLGCDVRMVFSYRFFLISILFIIFDVEISLMLPVPFIMGSDVGIFVFYFFMLVLVVGLMYEYMYGSLDWLEIMIKS